MTAPDPRKRGLGLDPAHIRRVCEMAPDGRRDDLPVIVVAEATRQGAPGRAAAAPVQADLPSRRAARDALTALTRVGYLAVPAAGGRPGRRLLVAGWSPAGLEARLAALRVVLHRLGDDPESTARAVIGRIRSEPARPPAAGLDADVLADAHVQLRAWVSARSGCHARHDPAIVPDDTVSALCLRAAWTLEAAVDDLVQRHLRVAEHAAGLFGSLRQQAGDDRAQDTAVGRAGVMFHLSGSAAQDPLAQDSSALVRTACRPWRRDLPPSLPPPAVYLPGVAAARPGGRHFPARRPGLRP